MSIRTEIENIPLVAVSRKIKDANSIVPRKLQWALYINALIISDAAMIFIAFLLSYYFRFEWFVNFFDPDAIVSFGNYRFLISIMPILWLLIFAANGLYIKGNLLGGTREYSKIFRSATEGFLLLVIAGFLEPSLIIARGWLLLSWGLHSFS
jgi:hypothetical protein